MCSGKEKLNNHTNKQPLAYPTSFSKAFKLVEVLATLEGAKAAAPAIREVRRASFILVGLLGSSFVGLCRRKVPKKTAAALSALVELFLDRDLRTRVLAAHVIIGTLFLEHFFAVRYIRTSS